MDLCCSQLEVFLDKNLERIKKDKKKIKEKKEKINPLVNKP